MTDLGNYIKENFGAFVDSETVANLLRFAALSGKDDKEIVTKISICEHIKTLSAGQVEIKTGVPKRTVQRIQLKCRECDL